VTRSSAPLPPDLSPEEWEEARALLKAISDNPATVVSSKMEKFSELFVRTLAGKGD
jgi:hypothetical protein